MGSMCRCLRPIGPVKSSNPRHSLQANVSVQEERSAIRFRSYLPGRIVNKGWAETAFFHSTKPPNTFPSNNVPLQRVVDFA